MRPTMNNNECSDTNLQRRKPKFTRSTGNRSRGGCRTCKQKHIKCDETRPVCSKCAQKGLSCEGYPEPPSFRWSYKHQPMSSETHQCRDPEQIAGPSPNAGCASPHAVRTGSTHVPVYSDQQPQSEAELGGNVAFETDDFSPSQLIGFDYLNSVGQALGGITDLTFDVPAPGFTSSSWPIDLSFDGTSEQNCFPEPRVEDILSAPTSSFGADSAIRLIKNWFIEVCPAWSGFDSSTNMNRKVAENLWHSSSAVFTALQSMSASFLSARLPHMRRPALNLLRTATVCVQVEIEELNKMDTLDSIPTGVIFSLICLGTSVCWLDARRVGWPFLQDAKRLLQRTMQQPISSEAEILDFFNKSLAYWDMLISFTYDPEPWTDIHEVDTVPVTFVRDIVLDDNRVSNFDLEPHPWIGISLPTSRLFTRTMRICRTYRRRIAELSRGTFNPSSVIFEFEQVKKLEEEILHLQLSPTPLANDTGDKRTPCLHLLHIAEAYQLASLLQLYIHFPALPPLRLSEEFHHLYEDDRAAAWRKWIIPLTLWLTEVLERIPSESGTNVMQPLLYACAGTGLRYGPASQSRCGGLPIGPEIISSGSQSMSRPMESILDYLGLLDDPVERSDGNNDPLSVSQLALDLSKARAFILRRLGVLKECLHPGPIGVAEKFVKAVWAAYDEEPAGMMDVSWIDVMEKKDFQTLFG